MLIHYEHLQLEDSPGNAKEVQDPKAEQEDEEAHASTEEDTDKKAEN